MNKEINFILFLKVHGNRDNSPNDFISNELETFSKVIRILPYLTNIRKSK